MRPIDADTLERMGYVLTRNYQKDKVTMVYETKKLSDVPSAQPERNGWVHIDDIYRLISGHSNYHGDNILAALTCLAEGKDVPNPITVLEPLERKKGKWINYRNDDGHNIADCDQCGNAIQWFDGDEIPRYCCMCGADMRGGSDARMVKEGEEHD